MKRSIISQAISYALCSIFAVGISNAVLAENNKNPTASIENSQQNPQGFSLIKQVINKSPNDKAIYQGIKLNNGMTVLLISDEKANKSLMSLALPIGSMEDPENQQGLAHYLEHMILMGSKKYPETNSLDQFLSKNGGYNNASTSSMRTAYFFEVNNNAFDEAVERFGDTIAQPLLLETNAKKEVNAVNAEMVRAKSSDGHLLYSVSLANINPEHPMAKFTVGNNQTLSDKAESKLQTALENFYNKYYSANLMTAVLYSNQPIEKLAKLAEKNLGKVENKNIQAPTVNLPLYREQDKGVILEYKPIKPLKLLSISFDMPNDEDKFLNKSGEYLAYVFNNNTDGTLSDYLIKQGLSDSGISASSTANVSRNRGEFSISVVLTDKGLAEKDKVISLIFQQIEQVKKAGIQQSYFDEAKESLKQEFQHLQVEKNGDYIESLAEKMLYYPLEHLLDSDYLTESMDKKAIEQKLSEMTLDNAVITLVSEKAKTDQKTKHFEAGYSRTKISEQQKKAWLDFSQNPEIKLPALNPYFATDFSVIKNEEKRTQPKLIEQNQGTEIYAMLSQYFAEDPKTETLFVFSISPRSDELKLGISALILNYMNELAQAKISFQSAVANMGIKFSLFPDGLKIGASGYTQHLGKLIQDSLIQFSQFKLEENNLVQAKQRLFELLDKQKKEQSLNQANQVFKEFDNYPYFSEEKVRKAIEQITLADIQQFRERVLTQITGVKVLSVGNLSDQQVIDLTQQIEKVVKNDQTAILPKRYLDINQSNRKLNYIKNVPHEDNALVVNLMAKGYEEFAGMAQARLLRDMLGRWYFDDLRTQKQLGYVVYATNAMIGKTAGLKFAVQSPNATPAAIMAENQRFWAESLAKLQALSEPEFEQYKASLLEKLQRKPESLAEEFEDYLADFGEKNVKFDRLQKLIEQLKNLTKAELIKFYQETVIDQQGLVFISQALGTKTKPEDAAKLANFEQVNDISTLQKQFELKED
ncbi:pitrilysin [Haemophilus paracuniculus]|uniref:Protease 3 n=1 Tax=Haemophilus paracuniculus TaxID=734 RepID=A0A1T0AQA7_9PAST|nr:pitrilysin [Haemophilus paracuniculus]OOR98322.1 pitrilysin [Haemophilus paracuniculus]